MYYQLDKDGFYLGIKSESNEKMEFWTETPISGNFTKYRCINDVWVEGATNEEINAVRIIPEQVPVWCIKVILHEIGLLATVEAALNQLEEPSKTRANYIWNFGNFILRDSLTVTFIGQVLQKNKQEIDEIFINANNIEL